MTEGPRRKKPTNAEVIAALLIENQHLKGDPIADWETLKAMTAEQVVSLFQMQHVTYNKWIEDRARQNHPTVLTPMYIKAHREVTAKKDLPTIAKVKRVSERHINHQRELARRHGLANFQPAPESNFQKEVAGRWDGKRKVKIKSRGFQGSRRFDGTVKWKNNKT